jgi:predicted nucleotidyltransferase
MNAQLQQALNSLRAHEPQLRDLGALHLGIFGSVARNESGPDSDIDVLIEIDSSKRLGVFEYARLKLYINELLNGAADIANAQTLKPLLRDSIERDQVRAF